MNKVKIFLGVACLTVAIGAAAFTKVNAKFTSPEYYITTATVPTCELIPSSITTNCSTGTTDCKVTVNEDQVNKQVFDTRDVNGACQDPLKKP